MKLWKRKRSKSFDRRSKGLGYLDNELVPLQTGLQEKINIISSSLPLPLAHEANMLCIILVSIHEIN